MSNSVICHQRDFKKNVEKEKRKRIYSLLKPSDKEKKSLLLLQTSRNKAPTVSAHSDGFQKFSRMKTQERLKSNFPSINRVATLFIRKSSESSRVQEPKSQA